MMVGRLWIGAVTGGVVLLLAAVTLLPEIDIAAARAFYVPDHGFPWRTSAVGTFVRRYGPEVLLASLAVCLVMWLAGVIRKRSVLELTTRKIVYLLTTLIVGPGIIVESILKPHSGRARPQDLTLFGGNADYTAPLTLADACATNCSFVSGHAAVAFWITAYAFIVPPAQRAPVLAFGLTVGLAMGAVRVMQGAHFVSDITYAGTIVVAVNVLLARFILRADKTDGTAA